MEKYALIKDEKTKEVQIGVGCPDEYYIEIGMSLMNVEEAYNGKWYVAGFAPVKPEPTPPTYEEIRQMRAWAYTAEVDCITAHIQRLRDESPVPEGEINELIAERDVKVAEIRERYPYDDE